MKQKKLITLTLSRLKQLYRNELPELVRIADIHEEFEPFKSSLLDYIRKGNHPDVCRQLELLIAYDGRSVHELSTDEQLPVHTLLLLYQFLRGELEDELESDLFVDLYLQFKRLESSPSPLPSVQKVRQWSRRWLVGTDEAVMEVRARNKERILHVLVQKIENRKHTTSRYRFEEGITYDEKIRRVAVWWSDFRFHLAMAAKTPAEINRFLGSTLSAETMYLLSRARKKGMPFFVTPYYLSLLNTEDGGYNDETLRSYIFYSPQLVETYGTIRAWEREDVVVAGKPNAAGWLLPEGHNIHRRYPEVAILIPDTMGRACGGLCASCQRMYDFQSKRLNFEFDTLQPKESWEKKLRILMSYFEEDTQLRDILITGGDALMSRNKTLRNILEAVYRMAVRKRKANLERSDGEKYAELQRVRLGTRLPAYLPMRINDELVDILREFKEKASSVGVSQFFIQTHFQTPLELTPEAVEGIRKLHAAGWQITNQLVFNTAASRRGHTARLRSELHRLGVICYYTFSVKGFEENNALFVPAARSMQERVEEKDPLTGTDRNVLNLPGIGKSMCFRMVGITDTGNRILCFDHDPTRLHSPIIDKLGQVYIVENKSIAAYLRKLASMGEDVEEYAAVWNYIEGSTEPRSVLYQYPEFDFRITKRMSNLVI
ncbi:MAG: KamA family protein [Mediterranea sp.]|jgi:lysine 2,3-aminomutase|nr:KamA family protein [Mediterranea sp.]